MNSLTNGVKRKIIFVDDEKNILNGLKRMLRGMKEEWDMHFFDSGQKVLDFLKDNDAEIVVSDMRMPGIDGAQLLKIISESYPHIVRIVLSGQANQEEIFRSVGPSHQYLSKPCDPNLLRSAISRACHLRDTLNNKKLEEVVSNIEFLPSCPEIYQELIDALKNENFSLQEVGEIIQKDISMTAKILKLVNSAYFGAPKKINDTVDAVKYLGIEIVRALILSISIFGSRKRFDCDFPMKGIWEHSLLVAAVAKYIASLYDADKSTIQESFTAGILHDCGHVILAMNFPNQYQTYIDQIQQTDNRQELEMQLFNTTHEIIGAYLLGIWGLPDPIVEAVFYHHAPQNIISHEFSPITAVHIADALVHERKPATVLSSQYLLNVDYVNNFNLDKKMNNIKEYCLNLVKGVENVCKE